MIVLITIFKLDYRCVGLDATLVEELFIDLFIAIGVWTSEVIGLPDGLLHLETVEYS